VLSVLPARYAKFIVAVLGAVAVGITAFAHTAAWAPTVLSVMSAVSVWLVPNAPAPAAAPLPPASR
jgi:hypothetical protein